MKFSSRTIATQLWVMFGLSVSLLFVSLLSRFSRAGAPSTAWARPFTQTDFAVLIEHFAAAFCFPFLAWVILAALPLTGTFKPSAKAWAKLPLNRALFMMVAGLILSMSYLLFQVGHEYAQLMLLKPGASFYSLVDQCMPAETAKQLAACVAKFEPVQMRQNIADFAGVSAFLLLVMVWSMSWLGQVQRDSSNEARVAG